MMIMILNCDYGCCQIVSTLANTWIVNCAWKNNPSAEIKAEGETYMFIRRDTTQLLLMKLCNKLIDYIK